MSASSRSIVCKVRIKAAKKAVFRMISKDPGRELFWVEKSEEKDSKINMYFPNGQTTITNLIKREPDTIFKISYFNSEVTFRLFTSEKDYTIVELTNSGIPERDYAENYAGWVSVLLALKVQAEYGLDIRNHSERYNWNSGFVDN